MTDLDAILALQPLAPAHFRALIPDGWQQGRGAFGGLVVALMIRAAEALLADPARPLRSLSAELCAPAQPGLTDIHVDRLRIGSGLAALAVRMLQGDELVAHASAVFARDRDRDVTWTERVPPSVPPFDPGAALTFPGAPVFTRHLEMVPLDAPIFAGEASARASGWLRLRRPPLRRDAAILALLCDVWWPALFSRLGAPRPIATVAFTFQPLGDLAALPADAPVLHRGVGLAARAGYALEQRELWSPAGDLLALNQQTFAVIR